MEVKKPKLKSGTPNSFPGGGLPLASSGEVSAAATNAEEPDGYTLYSDDVTLVLPKVWGTPELSFDDVKISTASPYLKVGGLNGKLEISKTVYLGGKSSSAVEIDLDTLEIDYDISEKAFAATLNTTTTFKIGAESVVEIDYILSGGELNVEGYLETFTAKLGGLTTTLEKGTFVDDTFVVLTTTLDLPSGWTGGSVEIYNATIDKNGINISGGGFTLPDTSFGKVFTLSDMSAALVPTVSGTIGTNGSWSQEIPD